MTAIEQFRAKVKAGEIAEALTWAMSEAIELKVTTWVASSDRQSSLSESQPGYRWRTRIDIVNGEVENEVGTEFINNPAYSELQKLHLEQVGRGREILISNLETLQAMFAIFNDTFNPISSETSQL
ncbi:hypothetical protein [Myxosarcina sp. GI1(2024)]